MPSGMKRLAAALVLALAPAGAAAAAAPADFDPLKAYGERIVFDVYRGEDRIGRHVVRFTRDGGNLGVRAQFNAAVKMIGLTVFRFDYRSDASWRDGALLDLTASTNDDGDRRTVRVDRRNGRLVVSGPDGAETTDQGVFPSNHWHPGAVTGSRLINTLTGDVAEVRISRVGQERIATNAGPVEATRYRFDGDLRDIDVWYDGDGRWEKLRFRENGSVIDYRCVQCVNGPRMASE